MFADLLRDNVIARIVLYKRYGREAVSLNRALMHLVNLGQSWRALEYAATLANAWGDVASNMLVKQTEFPLRDIDDLVLAVAATPGNGPVFVLARSGLWRLLNGAISYQTWFELRLGVDHVYAFTVVGDHLVIALSHTSEPAGRPVHGPVRITVVNVSHTPP